MKKPSLGDPRNPTFLPHVKVWLETLCGRRGNRIEPLQIVKQIAVATPTKAEYDALASQVVDLQATVNALIERLDR